MNDTNYKQKNLLKFTSNFMKMLNEEECENIKIKFWIGLEDQVKNLSLDPGFVVKTIFEEILNKYSQIIFNRNLFFCIIAFLEEKSENEFNMFFLDFLFNVLQNYEENGQAFTDFLVELIFNKFLSHQNLSFDEQIISKIKRLVISLLNFNSGLFENTLKLNVELDEEYISIFLVNNDFSEILLTFFRKLINNKNENYILFLLEKLNFSKFKNNQIFLLYENLCNLVCESKMNKKDKQYSNVVIVKLLNNIKYLLQNHPKNEILNFLSSVEKLLIFHVENIHSDQNLFFSCLKLLSWYNNYQEYNFSQFKSLLITTIYLFSDNIFDYTSFSLCEGIISESIKTKENNTFIISELFYKSLNFEQKTRYAKYSSLTDKFKLKRDYSINQTFNSNKIDISIDQDVIKFYNNSNLKFLNYLTNLFFNVEISSDTYRITFNETNFLNTLKVLESLNFKVYDTHLEEETNKLIFKILLFYFDSIYSSKKTLPPSELFDFVFKNLNKISNANFLKSEIYPLVITFMQSVIYPNYSFFSTLGNNNLDLFFNFLFQFRKSETINNITTKLLVGLYSMKIESVNLNKSNKLYALNKYAEFVELLNSSKTFTVYFNFCMDALKKEPNSPNVLFIFNSILKYSSNYEGALQNSFLDFVSTKFDSFLDMTAENYTMETVFTLNSIFNILSKDQPERLLNKINENFYNTKILRLLDKCFKELLNKKEELNSIIVSNLEYLKTEPLEKYLDNLSFESLLVDNKQGKTYISLAVLINLSKIFSLFISDMINSNKDEFSDRKKLSDPNNKIITSLVQTFDYLTNGILFSENEKTIPQLIFLNIFFNYFDNLKFFFNNHSYITAINEISEKNLELAVLNEVNQNINRCKNQELFNFLKLNENAIFLMKNIVDNIIKYEGNVISLYDSRSFTSNKAVVIDSLYDSSMISNILHKNTLNCFKEKKDLSSFFLKEFLTTIYNTDNQDIKLKENIYFFLLQQNILTKCFKTIYDLLNFDVIVINLYNIVRNYKNQENLTNFLNILLVYSRSNKNVLLFSLRLLMNKKIFTNVLLDEEKNISTSLNNLILYVVNQIIFFNSYKNESISYISNILNMFETLTFQSEIIKINNLTFFGKIITEIYSCLKVLTEEANRGQIELNKKFRDNLVTILDQKIFTYLKLVFVQSFTNKQSIDILGKNLFKYFENYELIINLRNSNFISDRILKEDVLKNNVLMKNVFLLLDSSNPKSIYQFQLDYCELVSGEKTNLNIVNLSIVENYILYQITFKCNEKLAFDLCKNFLFNKDMFKAIDWQDKYNFLSMIYLTQVKGNILNTIPEFKNETMKQIGGYLNCNILKRSGFGNTLVASIGENYKIDIVDQSAEYLKILKFLFLNNSE